MYCKLPHALPLPIPSTWNYILNLSAECICFWLSALQRLSQMSALYHRSNFHIALDTTGGRVDDRSSLVVVPCDAGSGFLGVCGRGLGPSRRWVLHRPGLVPARYTTQLYIRIESTTTLSVSVFCSKATNKQALLNSIQGRPN